MLDIKIDVEKKQGIVVVDGNEVTLPLVKAKKPGSFWVNLQKLGCARKWATVNLVDENGDDITADFAITVDETEHRERIKNTSRHVTLEKMREILTGDKLATLNELADEVYAELDARYQAEEKARAEAKAKRSRKMTDEQKIAKKKAELKELMAKLAAAQAKDAE